VWKCCCASWVYLDTFCGIAITATFSRVRGRERIGRASPVSWCAKKIQNPRISLLCTQTKAQKMCEISMECEICEKPLSAP